MQLRSWNSPRQAVARACDPNHYSALVSLTWFFCPQETYYLISGCKGHFSCPFSILCGEKSALILLHKLLFSLWMKGPMARTPQPPAQGGPCGGQSASGLALSDAHEVRKNFSAGVACLGLPEAVYPGMWTDRAFSFDIRE